MLRIINRHVQLITQSNDCCLLTFSEMKVRFERAWDLVEFTRNPEEFLYLHPSGRAFAKRTPWIKHYSYPKNTPHYHQKVQLLHVHKNGRIYDDPYLLFSIKNKPLFLRLINTENKRELKNLVNTVQDFCVFPNDQDKALLEQQYKNAIGTENYHFLFPMHAPLSQEKKEEEGHTMRAINKVNLNYLWEKKLYLQGLVQSYRKGEMKMRDLSTLYRHMTQVSEVFLDEQNFNLKKIQEDLDDDGPVSDTRGFDDIIGEKKVQDVKTLVTAYRVYGHFALCCLELFLTIKNERGIAQCKAKACKEYYKKSHGSQDYCSPECRKKGSAERSRRYRASKK